MRLNPNKIICKDFKKIEKNIAQPQPDILEPKVIPINPHSKEIKNILTFIEDIKKEQLEEDSMSNQSISELRES